MAAQINLRPQISAAGQRNQLRFATALLTGTALFHSACATEDLMPRAQSAQACNAEIQPFHSTMFKDFSCTPNSILGSGKVQIGETVSFASIKATLQSVSLSPEDGAPAAQIILHDSHTDSTVQVYAQKNGMSYLHLDGKEISIRVKSIAKDCNPQWADLEITICPGD